MHVGDGRRDLAQHRHAPREPVDIGHGEVDLGLMRRRQQVQHGVGRAAHGDVERHRVLERLERADIARQHALVVLLVVAAGEIDDQMARLDEEALAVGMGGERRAIAGQREAERLGQAVHRIGGEHARAGAAGRASRALDHIDFGIGILVVGGRDHRVDEVDLLQHTLGDELAGLHRPARDEDGRDVQAHRRHQHAGRDLDVYKRQISAWPG